MSVKKRFLEHLEQKGKIPKGYACGGYAHGGPVSDEWEDDGWNDHQDTSGEPVTEGENYMREYAFGGRIEAPNHSTEVPGLHGDQYGKPNFPGPKTHSQVDQEMSADEIRHHMVRAINARRGKTQR